MGYTDLDIALLNAWDRAHVNAKQDPARLKKILEHRAMSTYTRPLRSWSLVLRASDKRIDDNNSQGLVRINKAEIIRLCSPVEIPTPGLSLDDAARVFGVNRTTVARWASPADKTWWQDVQQQIRAFDRDPVPYKPSTYRVLGDRLILDHFVNRANIKRSETLVWTPSYHGLDPGGEVWSGDWGELRVGLAQRVQDGFQQQLQRVDRRLRKVWRDTPPTKRIRSRVWQWICPQTDGGCGRLVYKLYLPMPNWTLVHALGGGCPPVEAGTHGAFLCQRCAGLVYESSERSSSPGRRADGERRRVNAWDRFIKRISDGVLIGDEVEDVREFEK